MCSHLFWRYSWDVKWRFHCHSSTRLCFLIRWFEPTGIGEDSRVSIRFGKSCTQSIWNSYSIPGLTEGCHVRWGCINKHLKQCVNISWNQRHFVDKYWKRTHLNWTLSTADKAGWKNVPRTLIIIANNCIYIFCL